MSRELGDMEDTDKVIEAFKRWFEVAGFQPQEIYEDEAALTKDLRKQLDSWMQQSFKGWRAKDRRMPAYVGPFNYRYRPDIELFHTDEQFVPVEVELMKDGRGWKPSEAIGQAIMFSRVLDKPRAIAAVLDVRKGASAYGDVERNLQKELWEKLGVRLCVRRRTKGLAGGR